MVKNLHPVFMSSIVTDQRFDTTTTYTPKLGGNWPLLSRNCTRLPRMHNFPSLYRRRREQQSYTRILNFSILPRKQRAIELFNIIFGERFIKVGIIKWITKFCNCRQFLDIYSQWLLNYLNLFWFFCFVFFFIEVAWRNVCQRPD